jgi:DNA-binding SARP family transcriptional activator/tetratricopeptide (TPR) repeat protein
LAFLLLYPHLPHTREYLADLLWPDAPPDRVRRNFSDTLYRLRQRLGDAWLRVEPDTVALNTSAGLWVDVWEFEQLLQAGDLTTLTQAVELYTGDLLPEIYDDWILTRRVNLREQYLAALEKLVEAHQAQNHLPQALRYARRLIRAEPLGEHNHQAYLRLLGRLRHRNEALVHYHYLQELLQQELGIDPMPETQAIIASIQQEMALPDSTLAPIERIPFVGRAQERSILLEAAEAAITGQGGLIAIEGEAGIGKSRLLGEVTAGMLWRGAKALSGNATEQPAASPLLPLVEALAEVLTGPRLAQVEAFLSAQTLAWLAPIYEPWRTQADLPEIPPAQARQRFHQALTELFQTLARLKPHVLILDDLHWADPALWAALDVLTPALPQNRLLFLLAYRRPEIEQNAGWETLRQWERQGKMKVVTLKPLTEAEVTQILPSELQPETQYVLASTGGNPFFITEILATLAEGHDPHGDTILARAERLPQAARSALEVAAVLGADVSYQLWAAMTNLPPHVLGEVGEQLEASYFFQPSRSGYTFSHDLLQTTIYEQVKPARRRQLHRQAADSLAKFEAGNLRARAFHLDRARVDAEAAAMYRQAGAQDLARFAFKEAQIAFDRALVLMALTPSEERVETLLALVRVCDVTGDRTRQQTALAEALQAARHLADSELTTQTLLLLGQAAAQTGQVESAAAHLDEALALAQGSDNATQQIEAYFLLGDLAARRGKFDEARAHFETALRQAQKIGDRRREAHALRGLAIVARQTGQIEQAISWFEQTLAVYQAINDRFAASVIQANLLGGYYYLGAWDRLLALADEALAVKEALGDRLGAAIVRQQQGLAAYALGDYERARPVLEQVMRECEAIGERRTAGLTRNVLGLVAEGEGNLAEAQHHYETALAIAQEIEAETEAAYAQYDLGALYAQLNKSAQAIPLLEAARATWAEHGNELLRLKSEAYLGLAQLALGEQARAEALAQVGWSAFQQGAPSGEQPQAWLWTLYRLLNLLYRSDQADQVLRAAYAELQRQAGVVADAAMRQNFFRRVPLNRAIVAAYDQLTPQARTLTVTLACRDAPLGRALTAEEMVSVHWTINAPEDEAITSKSARRLHRLRRLLAEATAQGAAPTDDDLAQALGVSRRTILRDMAALAQAGLIFPTRRRK